MSFKKELMEALQNITDRAVSIDSKTTTEALRAFNKTYTCIVTFTLTTTGSTLVVTKGGVVIPAESDGTYALKEGTYSTVCSKAGYTSKTTALTITNNDETTGTKAVTIGALTTCIVTFDVTPSDGITIVVTKDGVVVPVIADGDNAGKYLMPLGKYSYSVSADDYVTKTDEVTIAAGDESTGTKTITVVLDAVGG